MPKPKSGPRVSRRGPLDNPYLADKLQKLQAVHEHTEKLMDEWHREILETEGKRPERVRVKAKNPGPRTEQERRARYGTASKASRGNLLSVEKVANELEVTERTVWNLISDRRLVHKKIRGRTWIPLVELNRYKLIHRDSFLKHSFSRFPAADTLGFIRAVNFGPWKQSSGLYAQFELEVTLEDWWRFAIKPLEDNEAEYNSLKAEVRSCLDPSPPEHFYVRFKINQAALAATLDRVVKSVKVPELPEPKEELQQKAKGHLIDHVVPRLERAKESPWYYLRRAVKNFYIDQIRKAHPDICFGPLDQVGDDVVKLDSGARIHLEWMFENQPELVRQLNRSNELGSYLEKKIKQARDLFLRLKEEQSLSEEDACRASVVAILEPRDGLATSDNLVDPLSLSEQKEICRKLIYQKFSYTELSYIQRAAKATEPDSIDEDEEDNR